MAQQKHLVPAQRRPESAHAPFCTNHDEGMDACTAADIAIPGPAPYGLTADPYVGLMSTPDDGARILVYCGDEPLAVDDAERFAYAILCQVARGRGLTPAPGTLAAVAR
ncbi:hypothetical protein [Nonomuraea sp. NPDC049480]|uniref:hypothetical protein n=1 Tax=Nonomuraea sp. NPDC049480 TaxID=3364353 RepID=UPI00379A8F3F